MLSHSCGTPYRSKILPLCAAALCTTPVLSPSVSRRFASLKKFLTPIHSVSQRSNYFQPAPIFFDTAPLHFAWLHYFPTPLLGVSRRSNNFPLCSSPLQLLRATLIFYHDASWLKYPSGRTKNEKSLRVYRTPYTRSISPLPVRPSVHPSIRTIKVFSRNVFVHFRRKTKTWIFVSIQNYLKSREINCTPAGVLSPFSWGG